MGIENYIKSQLHPQDLVVSEDLIELSKAEALQASPSQLFIKYGRPAIKAAVQNQNQNQNQNQSLKGNKAKVTEQNKSSSTKLRERRIK